MSTIKRRNPYADSGTETADPSPGWLGYKEAGVQTELARENPDDQVAKEAILSTSQSTQDNTVPAVGSQAYLHVRVSDELLWRIKQVALENRSSIQAVVNEALWRIFGTN